MQAILQSIRNYKLLFLILPVLYFVLYGFHGYDDTDRGFVVSMAHRIDIGEMPYEDYIYVRPPATPLLHSLELAIFPDELEMITMRFGFYLFMWLSILFGVLALRNFFNFEKLRISPWLLGILAFVLSVHNYPAMAWHTVDGIFFGSMGIWLISRGKQWYHFIPGLVVLGISAMSKQNFGLMPFAGLALILVLYDWKKALIAAVGAGALAGLVAGIVEFSNPDNAIISTALEQMTSSSSFSELRYGAYQLYIRPVIVFVLPLTGLWAVLHFLVKFKQTGMVMGWLVGAVFLGVFAYHIKVGLAAGEFMPPRLGFWHAMTFAAGILAIFGIFRLDRKGMAVLLALVLVNWSSGISWGYIVPILFSLPSVFAIVYILGDRLKFKSPAWFYPVIVIAGISTYYILYQYPFRDDHRSELTYDLGEVFPRLSHIYSGKDHYESLSEFKGLHTKYGDNFTVLPAMPHAHYLTNTKPPIQVDWAHDAEIGYAYGIQTVINTLDEKKPAVFVEKVREYEADAERHFKCSLLRHVLDNWRMAEETPHYKVYLAPGS